MKAGLKIAIFVVLIVFAFLLWRVTTLNNSPSPSVPGVISDFPRQYLLNSNDEPQNSGHGYGGSAPPGSFYLLAKIASSTTLQDEYQLYLNYFQNNGYTITYNKFYPNAGTAGQIMAQNGDYQATILIKPAGEYASYNNLMIDLTPTTWHFLLHDLL